MNMLKVNWSLFDCRRLKKMLPSESVAAIILTRGAIENAGTEFVLPFTCHFRRRKSDIPSYIWYKVKSWFDVATYPSLINCENNFWMLENIQVLHCPLLTEDEISLGVSLEWYMNHFSVSHTHLPHDFSHFWFFDLQLDFVLQLLHYWLSTVNKMIFIIQFRYEHLNLPFLQCFSFLGLVHLAQKLRILSTLCYKCGNILLTSPKLFSDVCHRFQID